MTGMSAQLVSHVVRRGVSEVTMSNPHSPAHGHPQTVAFQFNSIAMAAVVVLVIFTFLIVASIEYTVGNVIAKLAMIESATTTTIVESAPPAYTDEPDAPLEKKGLLEEADIEIVTIKHKPVTTSIKATIKHLHRIGGFSARWRGLRENFVYHFLVNAVSNFVAYFLFQSQTPLVGHAFSFMIASILCARFRMIWTHAIIAAPTGKPWYKRYCSRKRAFALVMPTLVNVFSQYAAVVAPFLAWYFLGVFEYADMEMVRSLSNTEVAIAIAKILSGPAVGLVAVLFFVIPANATLTRIEACLLPEEDEVIVPFDRERIMGDIDLTVRGGHSKLFSSAWKSVGWCTRGRVLSVYSKMVLFQVSAILINALIAIGILYVTGPDQLPMLAYVASP